MLIFACFAVLGIQCAYFGLFLYLFKTKKSEEPLAPPQGVSIIICAHNEEQNLRELIPLLLEQEYPEFELVVVEDRCNDGTFDYLMELSALHPLLRTVRVGYVPEHVNRKKYGLTLGIRTARHDRLLLTDADCRPAGKTWIAGMCGHFSEGSEIVTGFSAYFRKDGLLNAFIRFETLITGIQYIGLAWAGMPYMGVGRNLAYRKALFLDKKGFNDHLSVTGGDDDLFVNQYGSARNVRTAVGQDVLVYSIPKNTWKEFYYQKIRHLSVGKYYKFSNQLVLGIFMGSWICTWLLAVPAGIFSPWFFWIAGLLIIRWGLMIWLLHIASRRLGDSFEAWKTPFLEFIYMFYYLVAGTVALVSKKVRWKI